MAAKRDNLLEIVDKENVSFLFQFVTKVNKMF